MDSNSQAVGVTNPVSTPSTGDGIGNPPPDPTGQVGSLYGGVEELNAWDYVNLDNGSREHEIRVERDIPRQRVDPDGGELRLTIPTDTFAHTDAQANLSLTATMNDGSPLPDWLTFEPTTGELTGTPPADFKGEIQVRIIARDEAGRQAETIVSIASGEDDEHDLRVHKGIPDVEFGPDADLVQYQIPIDAFAHTDAAAEVELSAIMLDGSQLPPWLVFDAAKGEFRGEVPGDFNGELQIRVIARDQEGRTAETILRIVRPGQNPGLQTLLQGRPQLDTQLAAHSALVWQAEQAELVRQAREAALRWELAKAA
nr:putative Ig domain-containing protein [Thiorhodovibrio winogradskyi]